MTEAPNFPLSVPWLFRAQGLGLKARDLCPETMEMKDLGAKVRIHSLTPGKPQENAALTRWLNCPEKQTMATSVQPRFRV